MRYFLELSYNGTRYNGFQEQPQGVTIQSSIENALSILLRHPVKVVGCGRTDTGVHALQYFVHFDTDETPSKEFIYKLNSIIGYDIVFLKLSPVHAEAHARFDAISRSYEYVIDFVRSPFRQETAFYCPYSNHLDLNKMQEAAQLLLQYEDFTTFCKSHTDSKTKICKLTRSEWVFNSDTQQLVYHVTADRFLRGMIRLIVGMCLNVGKGKTSLEEVKEALEKKEILKSAFSAPAQGLFLKDIKYNFIPYYAVHKVFGAV